MPGHVFHRHTKTALPMADHGDGIHIVDATGKRYLDACGGAAVSCLGHSHPKVIDAIKEQLDKIPFAHTAFFSNPKMEELADILIDAAPGDLDRVYFVSGGSEAVEAGLKLARQYFVEIGQPQRRHVIARWQSYHGNTLGALAVGGNRWRREQFEPLLVDVTHRISPCYAYRGLETTESEEQYGLRMANELEAKILELGPETVACFVCEPVVGATAGAVPAVKGYLARIREICDQYGVMLMFDEVMCGMGRTGYLFACEEDGVAPDMLAIAKGLGAGYQPIGALMCSDKIFNAIESGSGFFQHGHTYIGHPAACAAGVAVQEVIKEDNLLENVREMGALLKRRLSERFGNHPFVGDIRGRGLFIGIEIVSDRGTKEPFASGLGLPGKIKKAAMDHGLMCYPGGGTLDGKEGCHILLAPPFVITPDDVEEIVDKLATALDTALPNEGESKATA